EHVLDRRLREPRRLLSDMGDDPAGGDLEIALVGMELVAQQREQARLAAAVGAGEADPPAGMDLHAGAVDEDFGATGEAQVAEADHKRKRRPGRHAKIEPLFYAPEARAPVPLPFRSRRACPAASPPCC